MHRSIWTGAGLQEHQTDNTLRGIEISRKLCTGSRKSGSRQRESKSNSFTSELQANNQRDVLLSQASYLPQIVSISVVSWISEHDNITQVQMLLSLCKTMYMWSLYCLEQYYYIIKVYCTLYHFT
jgi:hypothetical protein